MNPYEYKPLESDTTIRILVLNPSTDGDKPLDCRIVHMDRASLWTNLNHGSEPSMTSFETVSYAWGNPVFSEVLPINSNFYIRITPNVKAMLYSIRHKTKTRRLWIDAICLNQADNDEKAVQVQLMGDIYRQAAKVRIWLGEANSTVPYVFAALHSLAGRGAGLSGEAVNALVTSSHGPDTMSHIKSFLRRSWFSRRWIIQEAGASHARTVHCGCHKIRWDWMVDAFEVLLAGRGVRENPGPAATVEVALWSTVAIRKRSHDMLTLLWEFDKANCLDRHDHIYALLGLARDVSGVKLTGLARGNSRDEEADADRGVVVPVAYDMSWTATYTHLVQSFINRGYQKKLMEHLFAFGSLYDEDPKLPSWVPRWNRARQFSVPDLLWEPEYMNNRPFFVLSKNKEDQSIILIDWHHASPVKRVSGIFEELEARIAAGEGIKKLRYRRAFDGEHHIGRLLLGSINGGLLTSVDKQEFQPDFWLPYKEFIYPELIETLKEHESKWPYHFLHLRAGRTALARDTTQPGDLVIYENSGLDYEVRSTKRYTGRYDVNFGLVLRPAGKDPETYYFVGPCFVQNSAAKGMEEGEDVTGSYWVKYCVI